MNGKLAVIVGKLTSDLVHGFAIEIDKKNENAVQVLEVMRKVMCNTFKTGLIEKEENDKIELSLTEDTRNEIKNCSGIRIKKDDGTYKHVSLK